MAMDGEVGVCEEDVGIKLSSERSNVCEHSCNHASKRIKLAMACNVLGVCCSLHALLRVETQRL